MSFAASFRIFVHKTHDIFSIVENKISNMKGAGVKAGSSKPKARPTKKSAAKPAAKKKKSVAESKKTSGAASSSKGSSAKASASAKASSSKTPPAATDPFVVAIKEIPKGTVQTFQDVAESAERQGMGGMMRASSVAHAIPEKDRKTPWWRVIFSGAGKTVSEKLQRGKSRRKTQEQLLKGEGVDLGERGVSLAESIGPDAELVVRGRAERRKGASGAALFKDFETRLGGKLRTGVELFGEDGGAKTGRSATEPTAPTAFKIKQVFSSPECQAILDFLADSGNHDRTVRMEKHNFGRGLYHYLAERNLSGDGGFGSSASSVSGAAGASSSSKQAAVTKSASSNKNVGAALDSLRSSLFDYLRQPALAFCEDQAKRRKSSAGDPVETFLKKSSKSGAKAGPKESPLTPFWELCRSQGQTRPSSLVLYYTAGGVNFPHKDVFGPVAFPYQVLVLLSKPGTDFTGGDFYTLDGKNDKQSYNLQEGDVLIFDSLRVRHGMTKLESGRRAVFGFIFHLAK